MLADFLDSINQFVAKHDVVVHKHPGVKRPHSITSQHKTLRTFGNGMQEYHQEYVPHLHPEDEELIRYIKRKLAMNDHNRRYWKTQGDVMLSQVRSWQNQTGKFHSAPLSLQLRKFEEGTGFQLQEIRKHLDRAKMYKGHNPYAMEKELALFHAKLRKLVDENFGDAQ